MKRAVVIGADQLSKWVDWDDRKTCVLFGDGAGALAVELTENENGLIGYDLKSDGSKGGCLYLSQSNIFIDLVFIHFLYLVPNFPILPGQALGQAAFGHPTNTDIRGFLRTGKQVKAL